jgi:hypothetical protein
MKQWAHLAPSVSTKRMKTTLLTIAVLLTLAGCGGSHGVSDRAGVEGVIEEYFHATSVGRGEIACPLLTSQARHGFKALLDGRVARACVTNIRRVARTSLPMHATHVDQIVINDDRATAYVTSENPPYSNTVVLDREGGSWKLLYLPTAIQRFQFPRVAAKGPHVGHE